MARYGVGLLAGYLAAGPLVSPGQGWGAAWPWATLSVNVVGGLVMGLVVGWLAMKGGAQQESVRLFAAVGVLGGFTTFSAFSLDTALMIERRQMAMAAAYVAVSVVVAILAVLGGLIIARRAFGAVLPGAGL
ncbi:hypothetical protein BH10PSE2_BH10PSE2_18510 [soil metagenome]